MIKNIPSDCLEYNKYVLCIEDFADLDL